MPLLSTIGPITSLGEQQLQEFPMTLWFEFIWLFFQFFSSYLNRSDRSVNDETLSRWSPLARIRRTCGLTERLLNLTLVFLATTNLKKFTSKTRSGS